MSYKEIIEFAEEFLRVKALTFKANLVYKGQNDSEVSR